jgi:hypothetical protein
MRQKPKIHEIEFGFEDLNYPKVVVFYEFNFELDMILVARCRAHDSKPRADINK